MSKSTHCDRASCAIETGCECICNGCLGAKEEEKKNPKLVSKSMPIFMKDPPSESFENAARAGMGSIHAHCQFCGRDFIAAHDAGHYDEGEYASFLLNHAEQPDRYIVWGDVSAISLVRIDGKLGVLGCPCNKLRLYEDWIWANRKVVYEYLKARTADKLKDALDERRDFKGMDRNLIL